MNQIKQILICDDEPLLRDLIASQLQMHGFETLEAGDGQECIKIAMEHKPNAILLDINLPGMNGTEVLTQLHAKGIKCPVIVITGMNDEEKINFFKKSGVEHILYKPFHLGTLEEQLNQALEQA